MTASGREAVLALPALAAALLAASLLALACGGGRGVGEGTSAPGAAAGEAAASPPPFTEEAAAAGIDFVHFNGMSGRLHIVEEMGSGAALFDYDGDGDLDAYLVQGGFFEGVSPEEVTFPPRHPLPLTDRLYRNEWVPAGELRYTDVTAEAGLPPAGHGMGVAVGDYDGDGRPDLYVTAWGPNRLLRNRGDGTFEDVTERAGAGDDRWSVPAAFFDAEGDGDLDLWIGNYLALPDELPVCRDSTGAVDYCGPGAFAPAADRLLVNRGDGTFEDATESSGMASVAASPTLGVVAADLDGDGRVDLYVANDGEPNHLWINLGGGRFEERGLLAGVAVDAAGKAQGSMGVDAGDADGDGDLDLIATHLIVETNTLWLARGGGTFEDGTAGTGLGPPSTPYTGFGAGWLDYDGDGRQDLLVVNGAVNRLPELVRRGDPYPLHQVNQLFRNVGPAPAGGGGPQRGAGGRPRFEEVTAAAGPAFALSEVSRGAVFGDVDQDGDVDVLVTNNAGPARLLVNRLVEGRAGDGGSWVGVRAVTGEPARDAVGARVDLVDEAGRVLAASRVRVEGSYVSSSDPRVVFRWGEASGIGEDRAVRVRVSWGDGTVETFGGVEVGKYTTLRQGAGE